MFVTDEAQWIHHWLQVSYPHATPILDFYHVAEKLAAAAQAANAPAYWQAAQYARPWAGQSPAVEQAVAALPAPAAAQLGHYLVTTWPLPGHYLATTWPLPGHYLATTWPLPGHYLATTWPPTGPACVTTSSANAGCSAAAGPSRRSTDRTLLQVRLKRSGQRWSNDGLDRLVRLRSALKSPQMHLLADLFKKAAA